MVLANATVRAVPQAVDLKVSDVVVLIDREQGGASRLAADNLNLHAAFPLSYILEVSLAIGVSPSSCTGWAPSPACYRAGEACLHLAAVAVVLTGLFASRRCW
jgi:hypothetical protein